MLSTPLAAELRLESIAAPRARKVKLSSFMLATATPPMIGSKVRYTGRGRTSLRRMALRMHVATGSEALTMWAKLTAPAPRAMTAPTWTPVWQSAIGNRVLRSDYGGGWGDIRNGARRVEEEKCTHTYTHTHIHTYTHTLFPPAVTSFLPYLFLLCHPFFACPAHLGKHRRLPDPCQP